MAKRFLTHLNMSGNQIVNAAFEKLSSDPNSGNFEGRIYYNTADDILKIYDGTQWVPVGSVTDIQAGTDIDVSGTNGVYTISLESEIGSNTTGNAATATKLQTARTISLGGDLSGSASFDGTQNITISASVASQSAVHSLAGTSGQVDVSASVGNVTISLPATVDVDISGNAATATNADYAATAGTATTATNADNATNADYATTAGSASTATNADYATNAGSASTATNADYATNAGSASNATNADYATSADHATSADYATSAGSASAATNADYATTAGTANAVAANSVTLGSDTTGDYVASVSASDGISATGTGEGASVSLTNTDKGSDQNIFKTISTDTGNVTADSNSASVTIAGGTGINTSASFGTITIDNTGVLSVSGTSNQISASTINGDVTLSLPNAVTFPGTVTLNADPGQALEAATKQYVDAVAEGLHIHAPVDAATTVSIDGQNPPASIDTVTLTNGMRVLLKNQTNAAENGIYVYDSGTDTLSRASDFNSPTEIAGGDFVFVTSGSVYNNTGWVQVDKVTTVGTDPITFVQFSGAGTFLAGNGLNLLGNVFSIDTDVTVDVSTAQTLTNKTLTSPTVSGLYLSDNNIVVEGTNDTNETTLVFTDPTQDNTITFKNATGTVAFTSDIPSSTDGLSEGSTNKYFTNERAEDAIGAILTDTDTVDLTYTDNGGSTGSITADVKLKSSNSYLATTSGLAVDMSSVETKLVTDGFPKKIAANVGNNSATSFTITHDLDTTDVVVQIHKNSMPYDFVEADVVLGDGTDNYIGTKVTVSFASAPATNEFRVVIIG